MSDEGFTPRIVVGDDDDWATVVAALIDYQVGIWARVRLTRAGLPEAIEECMRAADLLAILGQQAEADALRKTFGSVPDDLSEMGGESGL